MMLHAKYENSSPYDLGQEDFYFFLSVATATGVLHGIKILKYSEGSLPMHYFSLCERTDGRRSLTDHLVLR